MGRIHYVTAGPVTEKDQRLIDEAMNWKDYTDWQHVSAMEREADTEEARQILHHRATELYRRDEATIDDSWI